MYMTLKDMNEIIQESYSFHKNEIEPPYLYVITIKLSKKEATRTPDLFLLIMFMQFLGNFTVR